MQPIRRIETTDPQIAPDVTAFDRTNNTSNPLTNKGLDETIELKYSEEVIRNALEAIQRMMRIKL